MRALSQNNLKLQIPVKNYLSTADPGAHLLTIASHQWGEFEAQFKAGIARGSVYKNVEWTLFLGIDHEVPLD